MFRPLDPLLHSEEKGFSGKRPRTTCRITPQGLQAFSDYVETLKEYIVK